MTVKEITEKDVWEDFLDKIKEKTFLQSWQWGEFQKAMGENVWRLAVCETAKTRSLLDETAKTAKTRSLLNRDRVLAVGQVVLVKAKRGRFLLVGHGPLLRKGNFKSQILKFLLQELKRIAEQEKCHFVRIAPIWQRGEQNQRIFQQLGFKRAPIHIHPELTWQLDLSPTEEELLKNMRKAARYLIKQGLKDKDLKIEKSQNVKNIEVFNHLYQSTVRRHHFTPFSLDYLKKEFLAFQKDNCALVFLAKYKGECLASAVIIFWGGVGFYHQGASSQSHPKVPASYLLQWEAIKEAKNRGCQVYNFWGIAPIAASAAVGNSPEGIPPAAGPCGAGKFRILDQAHPWRGLTLFKMGFGGYPKFYLPTQDLPLSFQYRLTRLFEILRRKRRGF